MANPRSNIYPVQLQGAELCLNKYDAEIKQYSGFNKNNSPFVGGCLSNIFTKEQQIEGGNADSVYIDANGDVYKVTTEGLWKNDKKVLDVDPTKLYDIEEIGLKGYDIVSIFDEKCFVYCNIDSSDAETPFHFILRFYDPNIEDYREEIIFKWDNYSDTAVDCKRVQCGENLYTWTCLVNYRYERLVSSSYQTRHTYYPVIFASSINDGEVDFVKYDTFPGLLDISYDDSYKRKVLSLVHGLYNEQHETLYLLLSSCLAGASSAPLFTLYSVSFNTSSGLELTVTKVIDLMNTTFSSSSYPFASYFDKTELTGRIIEGNLNSAITKDSKSWYFLSQNKIWLQSFQSSETPAVSNCYYKILADEDTGIKIKFYDEYEFIMVLVLVILLKIL